MASQTNKTAAKSISISDLQDIKESLNGDSQAYKRLIEKYQQHISRILWKFSRDRRTHEELVQNVFVEAYLSLSTYRAKAPLEHWFAKIAVCVGYQYFKLQKRKQKTEHFTFEQWDRIAQHDQQETIEPERAAQLLYELLAQLPPRDRLVLTFRYLEQRSIADTAELVGWSVSMVKVQTWRGKNKLKKLFELFSNEV